VQSFFLCYYSVSNKNFEIDGINEIKLNGDQTHWHECFLILLIIVWYLSFLLKPGLFFQGHISKKQHPDCRSCMRINQDPKVIFAGNCLLEGGGF